MANRQPRLRTPEELHNVRAALALEWRKTELELRMHQTHAEMLNLSANQHVLVQNPVPTPAHPTQAPDHPLQQVPSPPSGLSRSSNMPAVQEKQGTPSQSAPQQRTSPAQAVSQRSSALTDLQQKQGDLFQSVPQQPVAQPPMGPYRSSTVPALPQRLGSPFQSAPPQSMSPVRDVSHRFSTMPEFQQRERTPYGGHLAPETQYQQVVDIQDLTIPHGPFISLPFRKWDVLLWTLQMTSIKKPQKLPPLNVTPQDYLQEQHGEVNELQSQIGGGAVQQPRKRAATFEINEERPQQQRRIELDSQAQRKAPFLAQTQSPAVQEPESESMFVEQHSRAPVDHRQSEDDDTIFPLPSLPQTKTTHVTPPKPPSPNELISPHNTPPSAQSFVDISIPNPSATPTVLSSDPKPRSLPNLDSDSTNTSSPRPTSRLPVRRSAYQVVEHGSLPARTRRALELRYCAHVARMLASKSCVKDPPLPLASKNLWERMRQRLRRAANQANRPLGNGRVGVDEEDTDGFQAQAQASEQDQEQNQQLDAVDQEQAGYTSAIDFEQDVRNMLMDYVRMGPCSNGHCPYARSGNIKLMCWRMRLEAVLDEKMRGLKRCIRECEQSFAGSDQQGMNEWVDSWFAGDFGVIKDDVE